MTCCVLGVDGGSTKTIAMIADLHGAVIGAGRAGGSNLYGPSEEAALANIDEAVHAALGSAGISADTLIAGGFSLCGADWPEDVDFFHREMSRRRFGQSVTIVNDAVGGLYAGSPDGCGVAVVCGTGSATAARAPDGRLWHSGFWQEPGGAYHLAHLTLRAVYRADLGTGPTTGLTARVLAFYEQSQVEDLLHLLTRRHGASPVDAGALLRILFDEAECGDQVARQIVEEQGAGLGDGALAAARRVGIDGTSFSLVLAGGVFRHPSHLLAKALISRVHAASPLANPIRSPFEPVAGALRIALDAAGVAWDAATVATLTRTMPPRSIFET